MGHLSGLSDRDLLAIGFLMELAKLFNTFVANEHPVRVRVPELIYRPGIMPLRQKSDDLPGRKIAAQSLTGSHHLNFYRAHADHFG